MPRSTPISDAVHDLFDDLTYHAVGLAHGAFDLTCLLAVGLVVYASSIDSANAGLRARSLDSVQASIVTPQGLALNSSQAPTSCSLANDHLASADRSCITAMVLKPYGI